MPAETGHGNCLLASEIRARCCKEGRGGFDDGNWNPMIVVQSVGEVMPMRRGFVILPLLVAWAGSALAQGSGAASPQTIRPIGVVTKLQAGSFTLHTDAGPNLLIVLADGVSFLRVPPGATNLQAATKAAFRRIRNPSSLRP